METQLLWLRAYQVNLQIIFFVITNKNDHKRVWQSFLVLKLASDIWSFGARFTSGNFSMKHSSIDPSSQNPLIFNNDRLLSSKRMEKGLVPHGDIIVERPRLRPIFLSWGFKWEIYPFTPISEQDRISPYNINTISSRQAIRIRTNISKGIISWSNTKFSKLTSQELYDKQ